MLPRPLSSSEEEEEEDEEEYEDESKYEREIRKRWEDRIRHDAARRHQQKTLRLKRVLEALDAQNSLPESPNLKYNSKLVERELRLPQIVPLESAPIEDQVAKMQRDPTILKHSLVPGSKRVELRKPNRIMSRAMLNHFSQLQKLFAPLNRGSGSINLQASSFAEKPSLSPNLSPNLQPRKEKPSPTFVPLPKPQHMFKKQSKDRFGEPAYPVRIL